MPGGIESSGVDVESSTESDEVSSCFCFSSRAAESAIAARDEKYNKRFKWSEKVTKVALEGCLGENRIEARFW